MKPYEKPRLVALSLSGNDMLCGGCAIDIVGDNADPDFTSTWGDFINSGTAFGSTETECASADWKIDSYCKFASVNDGEKHVFNS